MVVEPAFDEAIHASNRLRLCGLLRPVGDAEFSALRATLDMSDANLSRTVKALAELGYVQVKKEPSLSRSDRRRTTSVSLTATGRRAFDGHIAALQQVAAGIVPASAQDRGEQPAVAEPASADAPPADPMPPTRANEKTSLPL